MKQTLRLQKFAVDEDKWKTIKSAYKDNQAYLASDDCCDFLDGLLSIISNAVFNFIAKNKKVVARRIN